MRPVTAALTHADRRLDTKQIIDAFRYYVKALKNSVAKEVGLFKFTAIHEHPLPLLRYCEISDRPCDSTFFHIQPLLSGCDHIRP